MSTSPLPWVLAGGVVLAGGILLYSKRASAAGKPKLPARVRTKAQAAIASSNDPAFLRQLAAGLQKEGATPEALNALQKAAAITGKPEQVPGAMSLPETVITPGGSAASVAAMPVGSYRVASGDIPGAIARRFGVTLSSLAGANGDAKRRIMAGQIRAGETLRLPVGAVDSGIAKRASGSAA